MYEVIREKWFVSLFEPSQAQIVKWKFKCVQIVSAIMALLGMLEIYKESHLVAQMSKGDNLKFAHKCCKMAFSQNVNSSAPELLNFRFCI